MIKHIKIFILLCGFLTVLQTGFSQQRRTFTHKLIGGFNIGATLPVPIPPEVRSIDAYRLQFTPQAGYNISYNFESEWGIGGSLLFDMKGMNVRNRVKYMHTNVEVNNEGNTLNGYFVGRNETTFKAAYITLPAYLFYMYHNTWQFKVGGYVSYNCYSEFKGDVWDGYLRFNDFREKLLIEEKGEATFDFGNDINTFDYGLIIGAERKINNRLGIYLNLSYGLNSIFPSKFKALDYKMHNIYIALGVTYNLK